MPNFTETKATSRGSATRQLILDAALEFLWTHSYRELTIAELMAATGITRPGFYHYFNSVNDLMAELLSLLRRDLEHTADIWTQRQDDDDAAKTLLHALSDVVDAVYANGPIVRAVVEAAPNESQLEAAWAAFTGGFDEIVSNQIKRDQIAGLAKPLDPKSTAIALNRMNVAVLVHYFGERPRRNRAGALDVIARIWLGTIYGESEVQRLLPDP